MFCKKVEPMVHGLAKQDEFSERIEFVVEDYQKGDSPERIAKYGLERHGMILTDRGGNLVWSESGHKQQRETVVAALREALGAPK
ncbi:MAG: hypothetical protein KDC95_12110 [Planctomycetes bacterium]|nr:hypothetical protein [Planctomycetota bacterium]